MSELKKAIDKVKEEEKFFIEAVVYIAKQNRLYYEELIHRGFSSTEALELVKAHGLNIKGQQ